MSEEGKQEEPATSAHLPLCYPILTYNTAERYRPLIAA